MVNLLRMDLYRMRKAKSFWICLILTFAIALAAAPLGKLLLTMSKSLVPEEAGSITIPATANLSDLIGSPLSTFGTIFAMLSVVFFFYADMENGYVKNIAGQMPKRGFAVLSRYLASIGHNLAFMLASLVGGLIGNLLCVKVVADEAIASGVLSFCLKLLLFQSLCAILLLVTTSLRSKSGGVVLAVLFGLGALMLLYGGIDSALGTVLGKGFSITPYMPDTLLGNPFDENGNLLVLRSVLSAVVTIGIFLPLSIGVFDKRDVK